MKRRYLSFMAGSVLAIGMLAGCGKQTEQGEGEKLSIVSDVVGKAPADAAEEGKDSEAESGKENGELILSVSNENMEIDEEGNYELQLGFTGFSGELTGADEVKVFTLKVYDKNDTLIYVTDIVPEANWFTGDFAYVHGVNRFVFEATTDKESASAEASKAQSLYQTVIRWFYSVYGNVEDQQKCSGCNAFGDKITALGMEWRSSFR